MISHKKCCAPHQCFVKSRTIFMEAAYYLSQARLLPRNNPKWNAQTNNVHRRL